MADRIEREIEEILKKIDDFVPERPNSRARRVARPAAGSHRWLSKISMRKVMIWALFAVIVAVFLRGIPGGYFLLIGAILVFVTAFMLSTRGGGVSNAPEKRWRGQRLDLSDPGWPDRLKALWKGRKRR